MIFIQIDVSKKILIKLFMISPFKVSFYKSINDIYLSHFYGSGKSNPPLVNYYCNNKLSTSYCKTNVINKHYICVYVYIDSKAS